MRELRKLCESHDMALEELEAIEPNESTDEKPGLLSVLADPKLLLPLVLVCAMQGGQQLSGINAVTTFKKFERRFSPHQIILLLGVLLLSLNLRIYRILIYER